MLLIKVSIESTQIVKITQHKAFIRVLLWPFYYKYSIQSIIWQIYHTLPKIMVKCNTTFYKMILWLTVITSLTYFDVNFSYTIRQVVLKLSILYDLFISKAHKYCHMRKWKPIKLWTQFSVYIVQCDQQFTFKMNGFLFRIITFLWIQTLEF